MKINGQDESKTRFGHLNPGDVFIYEGITCMKTEPLQKQVQQKWTNEDGEEGFNTFQVTTEAINVATGEAVYDVDRFGYVGSVFGDVIPKPDAQIVWGPTQINYQFKRTDRHEDRGF